MVPNPALPDRACRDHLPLTRPVAELVGRVKYFEQAEPFSFSWSVARSSHEYKLTG
jgi:hypothetical protein